MVLRADSIYFFISSEQGTGEIKRIDYRIKKRYVGSGKIFDLERWERHVPSEFSEKHPPDSRALLLKGYPQIHWEVLTRTLPPETSDNDEMELEEKEEKEPSSAEIFLQWKSFKDVIFGMFRPAGGQGTQSSFFDSIDFMKKQRERLKRFR